MARRAPTHPSRHEPSCPALFEAVARLSADDFRVDERLDLTLDGGGEHLWLHLEKRSLDTAEVLALLGRVYAVGSADVGVSGLKDRRAVARQWFSVRSPLAEAPLLSAIADEDGLRLLAATRHARKLRRGTHAANAFSITLRQVSPRGPDETFEAALAARVARLAERGYPNYIGPQRFGRDGRNVARALAWFRRPKRRPSRLQRGLWLSAARSELFNRVCAARVAAGNWCESLPGEPLVLDGSRSFFLPDDPASAGRPGPTPEARLSAGDVHPSAPWWGRGESPARGECRAFEDAVLAGDGELREGLERAGLDQARRALRVVPRSLSARWQGDVPPGTDRALAVSFELPAGAFATTLLAEFGECRAADDGEG